MGKEDSRLAEKVSIEEGFAPIGGEEDQMMADVPPIDSFGGVPCYRQPCPLRHLHDPK